MYRELYETTDITSPVDTGRKLNVHKTFRRRPGRAFNLRPVSTGSNTEHFLRKITETQKGSIFSFTIANLVNKGILYFSLLQVR